MKVLSDAVAELKCKLLFHLDCMPQLAIAENLTSRRSQHCALRRPALKAHGPIGFEGHRAPQSLIYLLCRYKTVPNQIYTTLPGGAKLPVVGLGTWKSKASETYYLLPIHLGPRFEY